MSDTWIVVATDAAIGNLVETARSAKAPVRAAVVGTQELAQAVAASGVDEVVWLPCADGVPAEAMSVAASEVVAAGGPGLVLASNRPSDRILLGAVAARVGAPAFVGATDVSPADAGLRVTREQFGGIAVQTLVASGPVALILNGGKALETPGAPAPVEEVPGSPLGIRVVASTTTPASHVDLGSARRIVAVGRGVKQQEDLALARRLAAALQAEVGCSRPLAEGLDWLPKDAYIGISGQQVAPDLYVAAGISGQLQHTVGVRDAKTIVVINTDENAPFFDMCDFGIVGDLYQVLPALAKALG
jgi:electron transfer flavoprotein alpha subunit